MTVAVNTPRACSACPWRLSNQGTRHPHGFYTQTNLRRLWTGLRTGNAPGMTCHPTDARMAEFEGYEATAARGPDANECAGSVILLYRELMRFQAITLDAEDGGNPWRFYRAVAPKGPIREVMYLLALRLAMGDTPFTRKAHVDPDALNDPDVGYPPLGVWDPEILVRSQRQVREAV